MRKKVVILGSTGSIGVNTCSVLERLVDEFEIIGIAGNSNWDLLIKQALQHNPKFVAISNQESCDKFKSQSNKDVTIYSGKNALEEIVEVADADIFVCATSGSDGLRANFKALKKGKRIALANKESLVCAGNLFIKTAKEFNSELLPVDSEHSAIFQALKPGKNSEVHKIILTASGGPFRDLQADKMNELKPEDALKHPTWSMGQKISIDSATMFNKALEIIEAKWLFDIDASKIDVVIHPQSLIHSMVEFVDGNIIAQMSVPDMKVPIQYALTYPDRLNNQCVKRFDYADFTNMTFHNIDREKFPSINMGFMAASKNDTTGAILNSANEVAVTAFLGREIKFTDIFDIVANTLNVVKPRPCDSLENVLLSMQEATDYAIRASQI